MVEGRREIGDEGRKTDDGEMLMTSSYTFFEDLVSQVPEFPSDSILSRTIYQDDRLKAVLFGFAEGQELSEHTASQPALLYFIQGEARLTLGTEEMRVKPGAWVRMAPQLAHSLHALTPVVMLLVLLK
jgi:quercetin dioxygenase-like cupin family protein